jgi:hypothetical protein
MQKMQKMQSAIHRYQLDGSNRETKRKIDCPYCGGKKCFTRYKDYETGDYIDDSVGACDRANKCNAHVKPKEWFSTHPEQRSSFLSHSDQPNEYEPKPRIDIPFEVLKDTLKDYEQNSFIKSILPYFPANKIEKAIADYFIGTAEPVIDHSYGKSVVFWFIDRNNKIRAGQVKQFNEDCKTLSLHLEDRDVKAFWIHRLLKKKYHKQREDLPKWLTDYEGTEKVTCLFGEHLLNKYPNKPVGLVEAPKSAILASLVYPEYVWLATTSLTYLTKERCKVLAGRKVVLVPDTGIPNKRTGLSCIDQWRDRVNEFKDLAQFAFSTLLEEATTNEQKEAGFDLADLILYKLRKQPIQINADEVNSIPVLTKTGNEFGNLILATFWMKDGRKYDVLYSKEGELITAHPNLDALSRFFNKAFLSAFIDGQPALINVVNN